MAIEDEVRQALRRRAARVTPQKGFPLLHEDTARTRSFGSRAFMSVLIGLLVAGAFVPIWILARNLTRGEVGAGADHAIPQDTPATRLLAPQGVQENLNVRSLPVPGSPGPIAAARGRAWIPVQSRHEGETILVSVSGASLEPSYRRRLGGNSDDVAVTETGLWIVQIRADTSSFEPRLMHLDPDTGEVRFELDGVHGPLIPDSDGESMWGVVGGLLEDGGLTDASLVRVDPASRSITSTIPVPFSPRNGVQAGGRLWLTDPVGTELFEVDPYDGLVSSIKIPGGSTTSTSNLVTDGIDVWLLVAGQPVRLDPVNQALRLDPVNHRFDTSVEVPGAALLALGPDGLWVLYEGGTVSYVGLDSSEVEAQVSYGRPPAQTPVFPTAAIDYETGRIWVSDHGRTVTVVDAASPD